MSENGRTRFNHSTQKTTGQRLIKSHKNKEIEEVKFDADMERIISKICDSSVLSLWDETCAETKRNLCNVTANEIIDLAINGCSAAETIANNNKQRPLFKNIQFIVAKTRQNVQKPDASVANLHSQGVPWVIRNLIFSFIRILDGWKGVKELLIEKHESFERIENCYYSSNIRQCFVEWQIHTKNMLSHIFDTFENLNSGMQDEMKKYKQYRPDFVNHVEKSQLDNSIQIQYKSQKNIEESIKKSSYTTWQSMDINKINFHHDYLTFPECTSNNVESLSKTDFSSFREISKMYEELGKDFLIDDLKDEFKKRQELNNIKYSARIFVNDKQVHEHEKKSSKNSVFQNNLNKAFFEIFELIKDKVDELDTALSKVAFIETIMSFLFQFNLFFRLLIIIPVCFVHQ